MAGCTTPGLGGSALLDSCCSLLVGKGTATAVTWYRLLGERVCRLNACYGRRFLLVLPEGVVCGCDLPMACPDVESSPLMLGGASFLAASDRRECLLRGFFDQAAGRSACWNGLVRLWCIGFFRCVAKAKKRERCRSSLSGRGGC